MNDDRNTWKLKAADGDYFVWHAGKNLYYVTCTRNGPVVHVSTQLGPAFTRASHLQKLSKDVVAAA